MWWVIGMFSIIWIIGWVASLRETETSGGKFCRWVVGPIVLFFIWPYIACAMARQRG